MPGPIKSLIVAAVLTFYGAAYAQDEDRPACITHDFILKKNGGTASLVPLNAEQFAKLKSLEVDHGMPETGVAAEVGSTAETVEQGRMVIFLFDKAGCAVGASSRGIEFLKEIIGAGA